MLNREHQPHSEGEVEISKIEIEFKGGWVGGGHVGISGSVSIQKICEKLINEGSAVIYQSIYQVKSGPKWTVGPSTSFFFLRLDFDRAVNDDGSTNKNTLYYVVITYLVSLPFLCARVSHM